jgi:hypothetical protein
MNWKSSFLQIKKIKCEKVRSLYKGGRVEIPAISEGLRASGKLNFSDSPKIDCAWNAPGTRSIARVH